MNQPSEYRKVIIHLQPCRGVVYMMVRRTRPCWPNPYSCITADNNDNNECEWTHFMSAIDGSRDGAPTYFEVPLTSTRYFISVYAADNAAYTLTLLAASVQILELYRGPVVEVSLSWEGASFSPLGVSEIDKYYIYSTMLLDTDNRTNTAVFIRPDKVLNTVCGLHNNTDREYSTVDPSTCVQSPEDTTVEGLLATRCTTEISGVMAQKRYIFNVIVESKRGYMMAYSGIIMETDWIIYTKAASDKTLQLVGGVMGTVIGIIVVGYLWLVKAYN
ncbi:hypothetical protein FOZ63_028554 [Perkinsus olseni]|uniref:Uncharacterized protein n=1 Tax=Perkinsus olseni TaxID=32597 RepID=A0A7J6Q3P2_PEROL|nr:hypothetical protein FOZ63_028554 [Perkinsus olseni]